MLYSILLPLQSFCLFFCQSHKNKAVNIATKPSFLSGKLSSGDYNLLAAPLYNVSILS